ncbi:MAG: 50S ribosomal protein L5 [Candidatus Aenigmarchaeota archaeon]|nr:50S ribosomal protein L5 [Candidatus Aenigmarchaeota archaeon]
MNPMKEIRIEKVVINIGIGNNRERLEKAKALLESLTGRKPLITKTKRRTTFGMAKGRPIGVKVTLRGEDAIKMLERLLETKDKKISSRSFDRDGNFSFGIQEHIDIPGTRYDPKIGIFGMDVCVTLERPGYRVKKRKISSKIGDDHKIKKEEAMEFVKKKFGVEII